MLSHDSPRAMDKGVETFERAERAKWGCRDGPEIGVIGFLSQSGLEYIEYGLTLVILDMTFGIINFISVVYSAKFQL